MTNAPSEVATARRWFFRALVATTIVKLALAAVVPFTTDEAYFVLWGRHPDFGYYDHGAMTGWWLWVMLQFGDSAWLMRLPAVAVSQFVGWGLWRMLRSIDPAKAAWAAVLYLVSPLGLFNILITTDTPLLFFSVVSVMFVRRGVQHERARDYLFAGIALGFAFLSKYFAVLLGLSYAVLLLTCLGRPRVRQLGILLVGIIPGVGINIAWNYHHYWVNVLFNLVTRQESSGFSLLPPLIFVAILLALAGPGVVRGLLKHREADRHSAAEAWQAMRAHGTVVFAVVFALPLAIFLAVSFTHEIGVHWVMSFFPFLPAVLFPAFKAAGLRRMIGPTLVYSLAIPLALSAFAYTGPGRALLRNNAFPIALATKPQAVLEEVAPYRPQYLLTTTSYAKSALLGFYDHSNVPVIGTGSFHAREDDLLTDFRDLDGRDIMIVTDRPRDIEESLAWFAQLSVTEHRVGEARFQVLLGRGFKFGVYREQVLQVIADRYYRMPDWLRPFAASCFFLDRYDLQPRPPADSP